MASTVVGLLDFLHGIPASKMEDARERKEKTLIYLLGEPRSSFPASSYTAGYRYRPEQMGR